MAKVRAYELAQELGLDTKDLMARLSTMGEFVRSASSTIEPEVARRLRGEVKMSPPGEAPPTFRPAARRLAARAPRPSTNPYAPGLPAARPARSVRRPGQSPDIMAEVKEIFGARAVEATTRGRDGYGYEWQRRFIEHAVFLEFIFAGLDEHESELAEECLLAGLRPAELTSRLGEKSVLEWLREGNSAMRVANTLRDCRADPASRNLVGGAPGRRDAG